MKHSLLLAAALVVSLMTGPASAVPIGTQGTWKTTLERRDINGDGVVDAWYDSTLDITWLAEPTLAVDEGFAELTQGGFFSGDYLDWVDYLNQQRYLGVDGWRLPTFIDIGSDGCTRPGDCGQRADPALSEMRHLYSVTLGNLPCGTFRGDCTIAGGGLTNTGPFDKLGPSEPRARGYRTRYWMLDNTPGAETLGQFDVRIGHQKPFCSLGERCRGKNLVWPVLDGDIADYPAVPPQPEAEAGDYAQLFCPGDVNLDGTADIVAVTTGGKVITRGINGGTSAFFALNRAYGFTSAEIIPDLDGNGSPELVALGTNIAEVRDLNTGELKSAIDFWGAESVDLAILNDINGNGYPVALRIRTNIDGYRQIRDLKTGEILNSSDLRWPYRLPSKVITVPGLGDPAKPVWGEMRGYIEFRTLDGGYERRGAAGLLDAIAIPDSASADTARIAALREPINGDAHNIALFNLSRDNRLLEASATTDRIGLNRNYTPQQLLTTADQNSNGSAELVVYEVETGGMRHKALINDGRTGELLNAVSFSQQITGLDVAVCPDINNNGAGEIAVLGMRPEDGGIRVLVKDAATGELLGAISLPKL